jgi:hypothetical protein
MVWLRVCKWEQVGYIVTSCLLNENHDFLRLVINTVRNDIIGNNETFQCLAMTMVLITYFLFGNSCIFRGLRISWLISGAFVLPS